MRLCHEVIDQMLNVIPKEEKEIIRALGLVRKGVIYKAPEETIHWKDVTDTLRHYIPKPKEEWEFEVLSIFTSRTKDEEKKVHG